MIHQISQSAAETDKILVFVAYVGHGKWRNESLHIVNNTKNIDLDLESCLRTCAQMQNVYCVGLFDCCRKDVGQDMLRSAPSKSDANTKLITVFRELPKQRIICTCQGSPIFQHEGFMA